MTKIEILLSQAAAEIREAHARVVAGNLTGYPNAAAVALLAKIDATLAAKPKTVAPRKSASYKKGMWPSPVYEGHFESGEILRMSFWSEVAKPLDIDRGRRMISDCGARRGHGFLTRGFVELAGARSEDPFV